MINKKEFANIARELEHSDKEREKTIQKSREIIKLSKLIIYALHRNDIKTAESHSKTIKNQIKLLKKGRHDVNMDKVAVQEYVEAIAYYQFIKSGKIPTRKELGVDTENYLAGLCDLTGELVRKAVNDVIQKRFEDAFAIKELVEEIYGEFIKFNLRGELRKKFDQIKWNLKKLEDVVYDIKTKLKKDKK